MSNNPFSKFVVDASKIVDPNTISAKEFENYTSNEMRRIQSSLKVMKRSSIHLAGVAGLMLLFGYIAGNAGRKNILGSDSIFTTKI